VTYVLLIYRATEMGKAPRGLDEPATLRAHGKLQKEASARRDLLAVARLEESRDVRTVKRSGSAHTIVDGPYVETKEWLVGLYLLECETEAEAVARAKVICADDEHVIEVRRVTWRWKG
jgi:hypothetical protein